MIPDDQPMRTLIFLGAGASAAEGAPVQSTLFKEYFASYRTNPEKYSYHPWDSDLATFFAFFYGIDVDEGDLDRLPFPTFEEVLGILEIACGGNLIMSSFFGENG